ncbi:MAG: hypothetical protein Q8R98_01850 [Rubrivivax sp.]|nr:hypothetical protein [Rubrivivax sp.]MDP3610574.1 hypothetical protein [Rubrivivax sp.]
MHPHVRLIYRAVRDAGERGLFLEQIAEALCADRDSHSLQTRLVSMQKRQYITRIGDRHAVRWVGGLRVPDGELDEIGAGQQCGESALTQPFAALQSDRFCHAMNGVPNSVWDMAHRMSQVRPQP